MDNNETKKKGKKVKIVVAVIIIVLLAAVGAYALSEASYERGKRDAQMQNSLTDQAVDYNNGQANGTAEGASNGQQDASASSDIGLDKAKAIALSQVSGAAESDIVKAHREHEDGVLEYEIDIKYDGYEYEFKINGVTGQIMGSEVDRAELF